MIRHSVNQTQAPGVWHFEHGNVADGSITHLPSSQKQLAMVHLSDVGGGLSIIYSPLAIRVTDAPMVPFAQAKVTFILSNDMYPDWSIDTV
jgi:hypothetical protein